MARLIAYTIVGSLIALMTSSGNIVCDEHAYKWIGASAGTDDWCYGVCTNPGTNYCPEDYCACAGPSPPPTEKPTKNPVTSRPTKSPVPPTPQPTPPPTLEGETTPPTNCPECPDCPSTPTPAPTPRPDPFPEHCHCICYGDPHCQMWNCAKNNWQGPRGVDPPGMVYYMTRCHDATLQNMPFDLISSIQRYDHDFTSVDYTILKIYDPEDESKYYCFKIKGNEDVQYNDDCSDNYDVYPDQNEVVSLLEDKFKITWYQSNGYTHLVLNIEGDGCADDIEIITQTVTTTEEAVEIKVSDCYKPYTCGLCGNYYDLDYDFERMDGSHITLDEGCWGGTANDETGLSYLIDGTMGERRRLQSDTVDDEPCFGAMDDIETECISVIESDVYSECCSERSDYCSDGMVFGCKWDSCACVMAEGSTSAIGECVEKILSNSMSFTCNLPSEEFIVPDMSIYAQSAAVNAPECDDNNGSSIWIGIAIGSAIWIVINVIVYFAVLKGKLNKPYEAVPFVSDTDQYEQQNLM